MARKTIMTAALAATMVAAVLPATAMAQDHIRDDRQRYSQQQDQHGDWARARGDQRGWRGDHGYGHRDARYAYRGHRHDQHYGQHDGRGERQYGHQDYHGRASDDRSGHDGHPHD